jgi:hypothetical protein
MKKILTKLAKVVRPTKTAKQPPRTLTDEELQRASGGNGEDYQSLEGTP